MAEQWFCNFPDGLESASTLIRANLLDDGAADTPGHPNSQSRVQGSAMVKGAQRPERAKCRGALIVTDDRDASGMQPGGCLERSRD